MLSLQKLTSANFSTDSQGGGAGGAFETARRSRAGGDGGMLGGAVRDYYLPLNNTV